MKKLGEFFKNHIDFDIFGFTSIGLFIASFCVPPQGIIDPSVLAAAGILFAFAALRVVFKAVDKGIPASVSHGDTTVTVNKEAHRREQP